MNKPKKPKLVFATVPDSTQDESRLERERRGEVPGMKRLHHVCKLKIEATNNEETNDAQE